MQFLCPLYAGCFVRERCSGFEPSRSTDTRTDAATKIFDSLARWAVRALHAVRPSARVTAAEQWTSLSLA